MAGMKWWGWGCDEQVTFTHEDKPDLAPFVREKLGIDLDGHSVNRSSTSTS